MNKNKKAFTLVELIVVITIIAILGTIAFISLQGYSASSRDSVRISDVSNMKTSLELFHLDAGKYPIPDDAEEVTYSGDTLWYQGTLGKTVVSQLSRNLNEIPTDPLSDKEYVFSTSGTRNEFEILNLLESDLVMNTISQTNAATSIRTPRIDGQYNGLFIKTEHYIFPTPSLITSEPIIPTLGLELTDTNIKSQVTTGGKNIPNLGNINFSTGELNIKLSVYSGTKITSISSNADKILAMQAIQLAYKGSELASSNIYALILNTTVNNLSALAETIILDKTSSVTAVADTEAPTGGDFTIPTTTVTESITLNITYPEEDGVEMYISGTGVLDGGNIWETCTSTKTIILTTGDGIKEVTMKFRDSFGNETNVISYNIQLNSAIIIVEGITEIVVEFDNIVWESDILADMTLPRSICQGFGYQDVCNFNSSYNYSGYGTMCPISGVVWDWVSIQNCNGNKSLASNEACAITAPLIDSSLNWWFEGPWCSADSTRGYCGSKGGNFWTNRIRCLK